MLCYFKFAAFQVDIQYPCSVSPCHSPRNIVTTLKIVLLLLKIKRSSWQPVSLPSPGLTKLDSRSRPCPACTGYSPRPRCPTYTESATPT